MNKAVAFQDRKGYGYVSLNGDGVCSLFTTRDESLGQAAYGVAWSSNGRGGGGCQLSSAHREMKGL